MKNIFITSILLFFSATATFAANTESYLRADYGLGGFTSEKLDELNANPNGSTFGVSFGTKIDYIELGLFYKNFSFQSDITHDGLANTFNHNGKSFGLEMNVFLNRHLSLKLGYAVNNYEQSLGTSLSSLAMTSVTSTYGMESKHSSSNVFYGVGFDIFGSKRFDLYASVMKFPMGDGKSATTAQFGIRLYMNLGISSIFGNGRN